MSGILLRQVVRNLLVNHLGISDRVVRVMDDANSATPEGHLVFIGISPGRWKQWGGWKQGPTLDEEFGLAITVSAKTGAIQPQNYGELVVQKKLPITSCGTGIEALTREIVTYLHDNAEIPCALNTLVDSVQFSGGLYFADGGVPEKKPPAWWLDRSGSKDPVGMAQTIQFYGLRRTQPSGDTAT